MARRRHRGDRSRRRRAGAGARRHPPPPLPRHGAGSGADLTGLQRLDGVRAALRAERLRCGDGDWVRGYALAYEAFADGGIDGRADRGRRRRQARACSASSTSTRRSRRPEALRPRRRRRAAPFTEAAEIVCRDGAPDRRAARAGGDRARDGRLMPEPTDEERLRATARRFERMNAVGLTGAHVMIGVAAAVRHVPRARGARLADACGSSCRCTRSPTSADDEIAQRLPLLARARQLLARRDGEVLHRRRRRDRHRVARTSPTRTAAASVPFWPDPGALRAAVGASRAPASSAPRTPSATAPCVPRSMPTARPAPRRRAPPHRAHRDAHRRTTCRGSRPRASCASHAAAPHGERRAPTSGDPWSRALGPERCDRAFRTARPLGLRRARVRSAPTGPSRGSIRAGHGAGRGCGASRGDPERARLRRRTRR